MTQEIVAEDLFNNGGFAIIEYDNDLIIVNDIDNLHEAISKPHYRVYGYMKDFIGQICFNSEKGMYFKNINYDQRRLE